MDLDFTRIKKILVVRMRHLGDVLLTSPVFTHLKKAMPEAQIDAFINQESFPMLEGHPAITRYFLYDRSWKSLNFFKRYRREWQLLQEVRQQGYDLVLNLTEGDRGAVIARFSGAFYRVGFDPGKSGFFGKRSWFTHLVKICPHPRHTVERQLDALRRMGIHPPFEERDLFFAVPDACIGKMRDLCGEGFVLIHPVSRWMFKSPPASLFIELIQKLHARGEKIVLTSGSEEESLKYVREILAALPDAFVVNLAGKTSLKELGALITLSRCLVTVDSVPLHMASALKAPVVALFGPSSEVNWGPWRNPKGSVMAANVSCRPCYMDGCGGSKKSDCLNRITPDAIIENLDRSKWLGLLCSEAVGLPFRP
jgi:heptosyltransferase III